MTNETETADLIALTADIVSAHVSHNMVTTADLPALISSVHAALDQAATPAPAEAPRPEPAVPIRASVKPDYIVCLEDGRKLKMLKRYLRTHYAMSPEDYRAKWGLPRDYPMVAPNYAEQRKTLAKKIGLGRKGGAQPIMQAPAAPVKVAGRTKRKVDASPPTRPAPEPASGSQGGSDVPES